MHDVEPYYRWRDIYRAEDDEYSPFYQREYSEFEFTDSIYGYCIHPQWDYIGSETLYIKILFVDYETKSAVIEFLGEWNDTLHNDIMHLKRNVIDELLAYDIKNFILIGESVYNFHGSDDCYYEEWFDDIEDGYIITLGFSDVVKNEWGNYNIDSYFYFGQETDLLNWRALSPQQLTGNLISLLQKRIELN